MAKVWEGSCHGGSELLMLLAIADFSDDSGRAYPSITTLATKCRTTPRYAVALLKALTGSGELEVHKQQGPVGRGGRTNLYKIALDRLTARHPEVVHQDALVNPSAVVNQGSGSSEPEFREVVNQGSPKPSLNRQEPNTTHAQHSPRELAVVLLPDVDPQVLKDWETVRKAKRVGRLTATVAKNLRAEAAKAGLSIQQTIEICCTRGWAGFKASWHLGDGAGVAGVSSGNSTGDNVLAWTEKRFDVIAMGCQLGLGPFEEIDRNGYAASWPDYKRRVINAWQRQQGITA